MPAFSCYVQGPCSSKKRTTAGKQSSQPTEISTQHNIQDTFADERYSPPEDDILIVPAEIIDNIEEVFSQPQTGLQSTMTKQQENGDPCRCSSTATGSPQRLSSSPTRPGPYTTDSIKGGASLDKAVCTIASSTGDGEVSKPPYAILSMFDGCGSSVDIIESKIGYRPKACVLCEKDETLRYLVGEKYGISVDQIWQHSSKGGGAFYYAKDVDNLFVDNARLLREFTALCSDCHFFVIGGSPCTDLTYAGGDQGFLGICGPASVLFFTMHLALHLLTTVIPSCRIRFFIENAGSMRTEHFRFMRGCLGLRHLQKTDLTWCTSTLSPAKRIRIFFQNNITHDTSESQVHHAADLDWPDDWSPLLLQERGVLREVHIQPFMRPIRTISDLALRYSWTSYHPTALLWRISYWISRDRFASLANLSDEKGIPAFQWSTMIPPIYIPAWMHLLRVLTTNTSNKDQDLALQDVLPLFHNRSIELPFRFLTDREVLQISGLSQNFASIKKFNYLLTSRAIRSFVGNSFHPKLVSIAIGTPEDLKEWVQGRQPSVTNIVHPDTVRKYYIQFRQDVIKSLERIKHTPKTDLEPEPYRHIDHRVLVMSPLDKPIVAQPTVGNIPPPYLTKEAIQGDQRNQATARLKAIGTPQFLAFLEQAGLSQYPDQIAVPQWLPFTSIIADALGRASTAPLLAAYQQGLFLQKVLARTLLFLRSVVGSCPDGKTGFLVADYNSKPLHVQYVGPSDVANIYLIRLKETLEIMIFKYGGQLLPFRACAVSCEDYTVSYSYSTTFFTNVVESVVGLAIQKGVHTWFVEAPFLYTFQERGRALWRLAQGALAQANIFASNPFVNHCHKVLDQLPLILVEGKIEQSQLYVRASTAQALCPNQPSSIWAATVPYAYCILFLCQSTLARAGSGFECLATVGTPGQQAVTALPEEQAVRAFGKQIFLDTAVDECSSLTVENGIYACIYGEPANIVFQRAQAHLSEL